MKLLKDSQGLALFMVIFMMAFFLIFVTGGLIFSQLELKKASNLKLAVQSLETADAGLQHALAVISLGSNFNTNLNCGTPPCTVVSQTSFPSGSNFSYTVTGQNDNPADSGGATSDTNNTIILNSTAYGPDNTQMKQVQAYVKRSLLSYTPPGALYFPASTATITLGGTSFFITGNDTGYDGFAASPPKEITGLAAINNTVRDGFKPALGASRYNLVRGLGYVAFVNPSVTTITSDNVFDVNQIALNFYNHPDAVKFLDGLQNTPTSCPSPLPTPRPSPDPCTLGSDSLPQITYVRRNTTDISIGGYVTGSGVLVTEGNVTIQDNFNFHGLVVSVDPGLTWGTVGQHNFIVKDNAKVFGELLLGPTDGLQNFTMSGNAKIYYSSQAIAAVDSRWGTLLPKPPRLFAWLDK